MAQLRQHYDAIRERDAEVVIVGPEKPEAFRKYWEQEGLPFVGLPDPDHRVAKLYGQQVRLLKLGRMPAMVVVAVIRIGRSREWQASTMARVRL